jgi:hypothetical protein
VDAIAELQRAVEVWMSLDAHFKAFPSYRRTMTSNMNTVAMLLREEEKLSEARRVHHIAIEHARHLVEGFPQNRDYATSLVRYYSELAMTLLRQKDHAAVAATAGCVRQVRPEDAGDAYAAAENLGHCVTLAEEDARIPVPQRRALAQSYADQAMDHLREAVRRGWTDRKSLSTSEALAPLRDRADFRELEMDLTRR